MTDFQKINLSRKNIKKLSDERLIFVDPKEAGFFDNILGFNIEDICSSRNVFSYPINVFKRRMLKKNLQKNKERIVEFIEDVKILQDVEELKAFYKPNMDPGVNLRSKEDEFWPITYVKGFDYAVNYGIKEWIDIIEKLPKVSDKKWKFGNEYQYLAFMVWLINMLVANGMTIEEAIYNMVVDSSDIGNYDYFKKTGSDKIGRVYDLATNQKLVKCLNSNGYFLCSGSTYETGFSKPIVSMEYCANEKELKNSYNMARVTAWLIIE